MHFKKNISAHRGRNRAAIAAPTHERGNEEISGGVIVVLLVGDGRNGGVATPSNEILRKQKR